MRSSVEEKQERAGMRFSGNAILAVICYRHLATTIHIPFAASDFDPEFMDGAFASTQGPNPFSNSLLLGTMKREFSGHLEIGRDFPTVTVSAPGGNSSVCLGKLLSNFRQTIRDRPDANTPPVLGVRVALGHSEVRGM